MTSTCGCHGPNTGELDVRTLAPPVRHAHIFETFDALALGAAFVLVNDHDPKPLFYQFQAERTGTFRWTYLEQGPETWRVEIGKLAPAITASATVGTAAQRSPEARAVLERMGINHCCGAALTLGEAAASAGVPLETLLDALNGVAGARA